MPIDLQGIDLVVFDKDGTLLDFHAMWGGWTRELAARLDTSVRRPVAGDVFVAIGFDPSSGRVAAGGLLAIGTMAQIQDRLATLLRRWCPSVAAARQAVEAAWFVPDPVGAAVSLTDLAALFARIGIDGRRIAVVTTDDRAPTDASLRHLGVRDRVAALVCGDDGFPVKPAPDAVFALCQALGTVPDRVAVVGDAPADMAMGRSAGAALIIGVRSGIGRDEDLRAAHVLVDSVADLG